jgi:hypothetical protein
MQLSPPSNAGADFGEVNTQRGTGFRRAPEKFDANGRNKDMDVQSEAAAGATESLAPITPVPAGEEPMNAREAARAVARHRRRGRSDSAEPSSAGRDEHAAVADAAPAPAPNQELAEEANAAPEDQPSGETQATEPEANLPPIEPPRSWTTEEKERFRSLPRELQAYLSEREQERDRDVRRRQNEAAAS